VSFVSSCTAPCVLGQLSGHVREICTSRTKTNEDQRSGELNAKHRELLELQALAQRRMAGMRANFADGMRAAKEVQKDLQWTQKHVK
jgi:biogenesis of lysosome-related organelles complex 1 subunit KXD1